MFRLWRTLVLFGGLGASVSFLGACSRSEASAPAPHAPNTASLPAAMGPSAPASSVLGAPSGSAVLPPLPVGRDASYEPEGLASGERRPLLLLLHGFGSTGAMGFQALGLAELGRKERIVVVAPDGTADGRGRKFWDAGPECCNFDGPPVDDTARLSALIDRFLARGVVDPLRVFVIGYSNGGFMAHRLACRASHRIAAVVSVAGAAPKSLSGCELSSDVAVVEVHGDRDQVVPYAGGSVFNRPDLPAHASAPDGFKQWSRVLGCNARDNVETALDLFPNLPAAETRMVQNDRCEKGSAALLTIAGADHYLGAQPRLLEIVWRYFEDHPKAPR